MSRVVDVDAVKEAIETYKPCRVFAMFSGGQDSLLATCVTQDYITDVLHIDTGIKVPETTDYVRQTCKDQGWPLVIMQSSDSYEDMVIERGFPGPAHHWKMYHRLKERVLWDVLRRYKPNYRSKVLFISGRRQDESQRRMAIPDSARIQCQRRPSPSMVFVNPILQMSARNRNATIKEIGIPPNPVARNLCMSGECLCGAFAKPGELDIIRGFYPHVGHEIDRIACKVKAAGMPSQWGMRPTRNAGRQKMLPLCWSCESKWEGQQNGESRKIGQGIQDRPRHQRSAAGTK